MPASTRVVQHVPLIHRTSHGHLNSGNKQQVATKRRQGPAAALTGVGPEAGGVEFAHVELNPDDGEHDDGEEKQEADLQQRNHGFHDGLQHHLETWDGENIHSRKKLQASHSIFEVE